MPENEVPLEELRAAVLEPQDETAELVTDAFREGMSAGLDFAYRVVQDFRESRYSHREREILDRALEVLVSEHDMRSAQPIRAIQVERATAQAGDAMLAGLNEALMTVQARNQDEVRAENTGMIRESIQPTPDPLEAVRPDLAEACDGPCCRPEDDPEPENVRVPVPAHSCGCGEMPGLVSGVVTEGIGGGEVVYHQADGPCVLGSDLATPRGTFTISDLTFTLMDEGES